MDYNRDSNAVHVIPINTPPDNWPSNLTESMWATEDDYNTHNSVYSGGSRSNSEQPPGNKKSKNNNASSSQDNNTTNSRSKAIGKMFFKTKLCCKFRAGTCPYVTNCNFAHSIEELRRPPPNWQEIVAAHEEEKGGGSGTSVVVEPPREEFQIPALGYGGDSQRSYKGRHCKKFYTEEGCPYGDSCTFLHDEQSKNRESTRICNKWELTGYCPFGNKCHFAHGAAELHRYGGGLVEGDGRDSSLGPSESHQGVTAKSPGDTLVPSVTCVPHSDIYHIGVPSQRTCVINQRLGQRAHQKWKGPDKISRIYGDWIDDIE
ncbi:hypothetical protein ACFE04_012981 [Oxalis oulophora]